MVLTAAENSNVPKSDDEIFRRKILKKIDIFGVDIWVENINLILNLSSYLYI